MRIADKIAPKLRFSEFNSQWKIVKGGELFSKGVERGSEKIEIYSVTLDKGLVPRNSLDRQMKDDARAGSNILAMPNDIAYNTMRMWQGAMGVARKKCMVSPAYIVLRPKKQVVSQFYLHLLKSHKYLHYLKHLMSNKELIRLLIQESKLIDLNLISYYIYINGIFKF